ncbi:MAG: NDP-sugar synthase [Gammaproteobacteria bacterium]
MKVFILAAGFGKRLRPFTEKLPKPLIKIKRKPLIYWNLKKIKKAGFKNIVINTHYLPNKIIRSVGTGEKYGLKIKYSHEEEIKGTGGALVTARRHIQKKPFLLMSGDLWSDYPFEKLLDFKLKNAAHLIFVKEKNSKDAYLEAGIVKNSKGKNNLTYAGISVINPKILNGLKEDYYDLWTDLLQKYVKQNEVTGEIYSGDLVNLNSKKELNLLDGLVVE